MAEDGIEMDPSKTDFNQTMVFCFAFSLYMVRDNKTGEEVDMPGVDGRIDPAKAWPLIAVPGLEDWLAANNYQEGRNFFTFFRDDRVPFDQPDIVQDVGDMVVHAASTSETGKVLLVSECGGAIFSRCLLANHFDEQFKSQYIHHALMTVVPLASAPIACADAEAV